MRGAFDAGWRAFIRITISALLLTRVAALWAGPPTPKPSPNKSKPVVKGTAKNPAKTPVKPVAPDTSFIWEGPAGGVPLAEEPPIGPAQNDDDASQNGETVEESAADAGWQGIRDAAKAFQRPPSADAKKPKKNAPAAPQRSVGKKAGRQAEPVVREGGEDFDDAGSPQVPQVAPFRLRQPENEGDAPADSQDGRDGDDAAKRTRQNDAKPAKTAKKQTPGKEIQLAARVALGDNQTLVGWVRLNPAATFTIHHQQGGLDFAREIRMEQLKGWQILRYRRNPLRESDEGVFYSFEPDQVRLFLRDGTVLESGQLPPALREFVFEDQKRGRTRLYSHFGDMQYAGGRWRERKQGDDRTAHPAAVRQLAFQ